MKSSLLVMLALCAMSIAPAVRADVDKPASSKTTSVKPIKVLLILGGCCHD
ncbi:MAG: hypothetical protein JWO87_1, partial [Phycisphaerales bacterium]|nr:hypothetical protein [Phycisphaerales bacterium]